MKSFSVTMFCFLSFSMALVTLRSGLSSATNCSSRLQISTSQVGKTCGQRYRCTSGEVEVKIGFCVTYNTDDDHYYGGFCPYSYKENITNRLFSILPTDPERLRDSLCGPYNRKGLLCGECIDGYGPAVYSLDMKCADCSNVSISTAIVLYLLLQFIPITLFFIGMLVFRLNITSGPLLGYMLFCQVYSSIIKLYFPLYDYMISHMSSFFVFLWHFGLTICEFWSLKFFKSTLPPFCISEKLTNIHILLLTYIPALYLILLFITSCILIELHARKNFKIIHIIAEPLQNKVFHVFATSVFLLSNENITTLIAIFKSVNVVITTPAKDIFHYNRTVLYFDPNIAVYNSSEYIIYLSIAMVLCIFLVFFPSLSLCIYPTRTYRYLSQFISARKRLAITAFTEAFHSCFKDGLNGTKDYRALAGLWILIYPLFGCISYVFWIHQQYNQHVTIAYTSFVTSLLVSYVRPCKSAIANLSLSYHFAMNGFLFLLYYLWKCNLSTSTELLELMLVIIPLISHIFIFIWAGYTLCQTNTGRRCRQCIFVATMLHYK